MALSSLRANMRTKSGDSLRATRESSTREERFNLRMTADERAALEQVAAAEHITPSAWLRRAALIARKGLR